MKLLQYEFSKNFKWGIIKTGKIKMPSVIGHNGKVLFWRGPMIRIKRFDEEISSAICMALEGYEIEFAVCGNLLTACPYREFIKDKEGNGCFSTFWPKMCGNCNRNAEKYMKYIHGKWFNMTRWVGTQRRAEIKKFSEEINLKEILSYKIDDVDIGVVTRSSFDRYARSFMVASEAVSINPPRPFFEKILREYFFSSLVCLEAIKGAIIDRKPDRIFMQHGCYSSWGPAYQYAVNYGIPVITWNGGGRPWTRVFRTSIKGDMADASVPEKHHWYHIKDNQLPEEKSKHISNVMCDRIKQCDRYQKCSNQYIKKIIFIDKPSWLIPFPLNWDWDGRIYGNKDIFGDSVEWIFGTLDAIRGIEDVHWVIKPYPTEGTDQYRTLRSTHDLCREVFGKNTPSHVTILDTKLRINAYRMFPFLSGCVILHGSLGYEASLYGLPVIGTDPCVFYANIGIPLIETKEKYFQDLRNVRKFFFLTAEQIQKAERFIWDYLFHRSIPFRKNNGLGKGMGYIKKNKVLRKITRQMLSGQVVSIDTVSEISYNLNWRDMLGESLYKTVL